MTEKNKKNLVQKGQRTKLTLYRRKGEAVGAGFFVFRRGDYGGRIRISSMPYEHPTLESATAEAERLAELNPGQRFQVLEAVSTSVLQKEKTS